MTLIEKKTLTGKFTIKETRNAEEQIFTNPFLGDEYEFPPTPISFEGSEDGFFKLKKIKLPVDESLDLISNLENLKNKGLIEEYTASPAIKENDCFIDRGIFSFGLYKIINSKNGQEIKVKKEIYKLLKEKNSFVKK